MSTTLLAAWALTAWAGVNAGGSARALRLPRLPSAAAAGVAPRPTTPRARRTGLELPEVVESLAGTVAAGRSMADGVGQVASAASEPLAGELEALARRLAAGTPLVDAFDDWAATSTVRGVALVSAAVGVARSAGGALDRSLGGVAATLREHRGLEREVRALSAQARLSASVLALAPVGVLLVGAVLDADLVAFLLDRPAGRACVAAGAACDVAAWCWMRRIAASVGAPVRRRRPGRAAPSPDPGATLPEVVDLLGVVAAAGLPVAASLSAAAPRCPEPWRSHLAGALAEADRGTLLADAVTGLPARAGSAAFPLSRVLVDALADGSGFAPALGRLAADTRDRRRRAAEERARRVPVRMLAPLVCCSLPAFVLVGLVPLLAGALAGLATPGPASGP